MVNGNLSKWWINMYCFTSYKFCYCLPGAWCHESVKVSLRLFCEHYKPWCSLTCKIIHYPLTSCPLISNVLLSISFCSTLTLFYAIVVHQVFFFYVIFIYVTLPSMRFQCCDRLQESLSVTPQMERSFALFYCVRFTYNIVSILFPTVVFLRMTIKTETCRREIWCK